MLIDDLPFNDYYEYFSKGDYKLHLPTKQNLDNLNSQEYLQDTLRQVLRVLRSIESAPSVPIFTGQSGTTQIPGSGQDFEERERLMREEVGPEQRLTAGVEGRAASALDAIAPESRKESALGGFGGADGSSLEDGATAWKVAPAGEEDEEGL